METKAQERRSVVASGKTVRDAIANGLAMLGAHREQVDVEVLSEGSRGVLGFGAENARVRLLVKAPAILDRITTSTPEPPAAREQESEVALAARAHPPAPVSVPVPAPAPAAEAVKGAAEQVGSEVLSDLLRLMGIQASVEAHPADELAEEGQGIPTVLNVRGNDLGILIGRRGETLWALQYLVRLMVSHRLKHWTNLLVDVEDYRVRRRHALENLARREADEAVRTGRTRALEPMAPYDRRLVHMALRNHPRVTTQSVGQGEKRKVTIIPRR